MKPMIKIEVRRNFKIWTYSLIAVLIVQVVLLILGYGNVKTFSEQRLDFLKAEKAKINQTLKLMQFHVFYPRILFATSPIESIFFNSTVFPDLIASVDNRIKIEINNTQMGSNIFRQERRVGIDLSWFILIFVTLVVGIWGFFSLRHTDYLKSVLKYLSIKKIYAGIQYARLLLIGIGILILMCMCLLQFKIEGFDLNQNTIKAILLFYLVTFLLAVFFYLVGARMGSTENPLKGALIGIFLWFTLVLLIPVILISSLSKIAESKVKSFYAYEKQKIDLFIGFENRFTEAIKSKISLSEKKEETKRLIKNYLENDFQKIIQCDYDLLMNIERQINAINSFKMLTPATFYILINNELSSKGYNEYINYYKKLLDIYKRYVHYFYDLRLKDEIPKKFFLKDEELVYNANPSLPANIGIGIALTSFYFLWLFWVCFLAFRKSLIPYPIKEIQRLKQLSIPLEKRKTTVCITAIREIKESICAYFTGYEKNFPGKVELFENGKQIILTTVPETLYICQPGQIPQGIKAKDMFFFLCELSRASKEKIVKAYQSLNMEKIANTRFGDLFFSDKLKILLVPIQFKEFQLILFNEIETDLSVDESKLIIDEIINLKKDRFVLYLTKNLFFATQISDYLKPMKNENTFVFSK